MLKSVFILLCLVSFKGVSQEHIDFDKLLQIERVKSFPYCGKLNLSQNFPNPFKTTQISTINYRAIDAPQASVVIFNLKGESVLKFAELYSGVGEVVIEGNQLSPGVYIYALIVNGRVIARKKMAITN